MSTYISVEELKAVLGVGDLYADPLLQQVCDAAELTVLAYCVDLEGLQTAPVSEAILAVAVDLWQSRLAPGGQIQAVDFQPGPYRLGKSLLSRVSGLLGPYLNVEGMVG